MDNLKLKLHQLQYICIDAIKTLTDQNLIVEVETISNNFQYGLRAPALIQVKQNLTVTQGSGNNNY